MNHHQAPNDPGNGPGITYVNPYIWHVKYLLRRHVGKIAMAAVVIGLSLISAALAADYEETEIPAHDSPFRMPTVTVTGLPTSAYIGEGRHIARYRCEGAFWLGDALSVQVDLCTPGDTDQGDGNIGWSVDPRDAVNVFTYLEGASGWVDIDSIETSWGMANVARFNLDPIATGHQCGAMAVGKDRVPRLGDHYATRLLMYVCAEGNFAVADDLMAETLKGLTYGGEGLF